MTFRELHLKSKSKPMYKEAYRLYKAIMKNWSYKWGDKHSIKGEFAGAMVSPKEDSMAKFITRNKSKSL
jgi:hypothetical protein